MASKKLVRSGHREEYIPGKPVRSGYPSHGEADRDLNQYVRPLVEVHGSGMHDWGIAYGLGVTATSAQPNIKVEAGIALDSGGRHISLAVDSKARIDIHDPSVVSDLVDVVVTGGIAQAEIPTVGLSGVKYVTLQWNEPFDDPAYYSVENIYRYNHFPYIRFQNLGDFDPNTGDVICLAKVTLDGTGNVIGLTHDLRRNVGLPAETVRLLQGRTASGSPNFSVDSADAATIQPRAAGGMDVTVPNAGDEVEIKRNGGSFAKLSVTANHIVARRSDGKESVVVDTQGGDITAGTHGVNGNIRVKDSNNRTAISLHASDGSVHIGTSGNEGDLLVKDGAGQTTFQVNGANGKVYLKRLDPIGNVLHIDARFVRIHGWDLVLDGRSGGNKRALVDWNNRLVVNFATDYANGVDINKLHLAPHIKVYFWEAWGPYNPGRVDWHTFFSLDTQLKWAEWNYMTMCEIGMYDRGTVAHFWWQTDNESYVNGSGNIVIRWKVSYNDNGTDWMPWQRSVCWIAFRR